MDWNEINRQSEGLVATSTYLVLFVNDQVYNYTVSLMDALRKSALYKGSVKRMANRMERNMSVYNTDLFKVYKVDADSFAETTSLMEETVGPHIEKYCFTLSRILSDNDISGEANRICSLSSTINMLTQTSRCAIKHFGNRVSRFARHCGNPLTRLALGEVETLSDKLSNCVAGDGIKVNLNEKPGIMAAFEAIMGALLNPQLMNRAFEMVEFEN